MVPAQAKVSRKRWANLRSDLAAAIDASGLLPMLKTAGVELDRRLEEPVTGAHRPAGSPRPLAFRPLGEPARDPAGGRRRCRDRTLHRGAPCGNPDPQPWCPAPQRGTDLEHPVCAKTRLEPVRRRGADEQTGANSRALGAASGLLPRGCRSAPRLVCDARPARRAGAGKSAGAADAAIAGRPYPFRRDGGLFRGDRCRIA